MKWMTFVLMAALAVVVVGCGDGWPAHKGTSQGTGDKKLTVTGPKDVDLKQGESTKVAIEVKRENFDDDVDVEFHVPADSGLSIKETDTKIAKGSNKREYTLEAGDKATEGSQTIKYDVKGPSATKTEFKGEFKVNVKKK